MKMRHLWGPEHPFLSVELIEGTANDLSVSQAQGVDPSAFGWQA